MANVTKDILMFSQQYAKRFLTAEKLKSKLKTHHLSILQGQQDQTVRSSVGSPHPHSFKILSALKHLNWPHKEFTGQRLNRSRTFINPFIALSASNNFKCKTIYVPLSLSKRIFLEEIQLRANISAGNLIKGIFQTRKSIAQLLRIKKNCFSL